MRVPWVRRPKAEPKRATEPERKRKQQVHPEIKRATDTGLGVWFPASTQSIWIPRPEDE